ncbi:Aldehyde dehydrogenase 8 member A1, partial [Coemansia sp. RSA 2703]
MSIMSAFKIPANVNDLKIQNYINGQWCPPTTNKYMNSFNPATGQQSYPIPDSNHADVDNAVRAAKAAFPMWSSTTPEARAAILNRVADLIDQHADQLAAIESQDQGKTVASARVSDMPLCSGYFRQFARCVVEGFTESQSRMNAPCTMASVTNVQNSVLQSNTQH